LIWYHW